MGAWQPLSPYIPVPPTSSPHSPSPHFFTPTRHITQPPVDSTFKSTQRAFGNTLNVLAIFAARFCLSCRHCVFIVGYIFDVCDASFSPQYLF
jgi:hypothetical protein